MLGKDIKKMSAEELRAANPELYVQLISTGATAESEANAAALKELKDKNAKLENDAAIRSNATKLGLVAKGEELIAANTSLSDALPKLIDARAAGESESNNIRQQFINTAPQAAGNSPESNSTVKTKEGVIKALMESDPKLTKGQAVKAARRTNPSLFIGRLIQAAQLASGGEI